MVQEMSVVTPEIRFFADCHWLMADNIILLRITPMLPYEWSNLRRLFDCKSTFETRSGPFDYWRIRLEFDGNLIHWTVSDGWWHPKTTTFDTDYETTMTVLFDVGYDQWRKDRGIMDEADKAVKRLNDSGIPATRSSDPDYLVFEVGESVFRALSFSGVRTPAFRPVVKRLYLCHAGRFWFSMYRLNVSSGAPPAVPA